VQNYPRGGKALRGAFTRFQPRDTVEWFASHSVTLKTEADGRMFPVTDDSATIVNCLIRAAEDAGVNICTGDAVVSVNKLTLEDWHGGRAITKEPGFEIELKGQN
jgi:Predicted flavoproteins